MNQNWQTRQPKNTHLNNYSRALGRILFNTLLYLPVLLWGIHWYWFMIVNRSNQLGGSNLILAGPLFALGALVILYCGCDLGYSYWQSIKNLLNARFKKEGNPYV